MKNKTNEKTCLIKMKMQALFVEKPKIKTLPN
jgi:hypothetical protein